MRRKLFIYAISASVISLSSCGLLKKEEVQSQKPGIIISQTTTTPTDSVIETAPVTSKFDKGLEGEWTIMSAYGKKFNLEEMPFINFDIKEGRMYGNNGCNVVNAAIETANNNELKFGNMITSLMACPDSKTETLINNALNHAAGYAFTNNDGIRYLNIKDAKGSVILTLKPHNLDILNGAWTVSEINGEAVNDEKVKLVIDIEEAKLHGNSGCNIINGQIVFDPKKNDAIQFSQIASTRMACPDMKTETALLVALEEVVYYKKKNSSEIGFYDDNNNQILVLKRLPLMN